MDERLSRVILIRAGAIALLFSTMSCESWFGPAEGDGIRSVTPSGIEVVADDCCGAKVRIDGGPIVLVSGRHVFSDLSAGRHTVAILDCQGECGGVWGGGYCNCNDKWHFCSVDLYQGEHVVIRAGTSCY